MKNLLLVSALLLVACGGGSKSTKTAENAPTGGPGEPAVDPTVPSWAPKSCIAYHKVVVQALECQAIEQGKRDSIKTKYDADAAAWQAMTDAEPGKIAEVGTACEGETTTVQAEITGKCDNSGT